MFQNVRELILKALLMHCVSSIKQNSEFFNMSTGISPTVALSDGTFFSNFLGFFHNIHYSILRNRLKRDFYFDILFYFNILECLENLTIIYSVLSLL